MNVHGKRRKLVSRLSAILVRTVRPLIFVYAFQKNNTIMEEKENKKVKKEGRKKEMGEREEKRKKK